jgi:hypothetical protein
MLPLRALNVEKIFGARSARKTQNEGRAITRF